MKKPIKVFVSGGFGIIHGGHIKFFEDAKKFGDYLIVSFAGDEEMMKYKGRHSALPESHRRKILESLRVVDEVVMGKLSDKYAQDPIFDFADEFIRLKPDILVSTEDDMFALPKLEFAKAHGATYIQIPKTTELEPLSTTDIRERIKNDAS